MADTRHRTGGHAGQWPISAAGVTRSREVHADMPSSLTPADEGDRREVHVAARQLAPVGGAALHVTVTAVSLVAG